MTRGACAYALVCFLLSGLPAPGTDAARLRGGESNGAASCLAMREPRPKTVHGAGNITVEVKTMADYADKFVDLVENPGLLNPNGPKFDRKASPCVREVPKIIHFVWLGSPLKEKYAHNINLFAGKNPQHQIMLWHYEPIGANASSILKVAEHRPAGGVIMKSLAEEKHQFRNWDLVESNPNFGAKSDYVRLEAVFLHGGIYMDTDAIPIHSFDEYGSLFRWPFVSQTDDIYHNICNGIFSAEKGSGFLDFAITAAGQNCREFGICKVVAGAGPPFFTQALKRYDEPEILLIDQRHLVTPQSPESIVYQTVDASWDPNKERWEREHSG